MAKTRVCADLNDDSDDYGAQNEALLEVVGVIL